MLRQLLSALKSGDVLNEAFVQFGEMLKHAEWMFMRANEVLRAPDRADSIRDPLYDRDKSINNLLRSIRRKIVRHLTINPSTDVAACLALMSVARDAERIGDYCKNVFEVGQFYRQGFHVARYHEPLEEIRLDVVALFTDVSKAFADSNPSAARQAIEQAHELRTRCDGVIEQLLRDTTSIQTHEAVAYSLLARHYKRVVAHLANIATAVVGSIEDLDFRP